MRQRCTGLPERGRGSGARLLELGYDPRQLPDVAPPAVVAVFDRVFKQSVPTQRAFNRSFKPFAEGLGTTAMRASSHAVKSYVLLPEREDLVSGRFLHELAHNWVAYLDGPDVLSAQLERFSHHWGFSSVGGMLGGWEPGTLEDLGGGRFRADVAPAGIAVPFRPYAPLELYLMGLADASEVPAITVAVEPVEVIAKEPLVEFRTDGFETVTIQEILAANGLRKPSIASAPKRFELGVLIVARTALTPAQWDFYERALDFMSVPASARVEEIFAAEQFRPERGLWQDIEHQVRQPLLNFFSATGQRGSLSFVPARTESRGGF